MKINHSNRSFFDTFLRNVEVLNSPQVAIIGNATYAIDLAKTCAGRNIKTLLWGKSIRDFDLDSSYITCFELKADSAENRWSILQDIPLILIISCKAHVIKEVMDAVGPFCRIIILGPIDGISEDVDFYSTVHYKNLELKFITIQNMER